jgi:antitoxin VapB
LTYSKIIEYNIYHDIYHGEERYMDTAKIFKNGRSQAVRLPKEYRIDNNEVYIKKFEDIVMLIPKDSQWKVMEKAAEYFSDDFMVVRNQPEIQKREDL